MTQRDYYFDNGKFLLIFLVVFGHFIRSFVDDSIFIRALYNTIYTFHMPAFILISGYFATPELNKGKLLKLIKKLLVPYVIFQTIYILFYHILLGEPLDFNYLYPEWSLWFLLSLFSWQLLLFIFARLKKFVALSVAIILGILIGHLQFPGGFLSLSRTIVFFPFFLLGYYMKREHFTLLRSKKMIFPAVNIILLTFILFYTNTNFDFHWLFGSKLYSEMETVLSSPSLQRVVIYLLSILMVGCFFVFVPEKKYRFTFVGRYTLYVYLLHGFFIRLFRAIPWPEWIVHEYFVWGAMVLSLLLIFILSHKYTRALTQPIIEGKWTQMKQMLRQLLEHRKHLHAK